MCRKIFLLAPAGRSLRIVVPLQEALPSAAALPLAEALLPAEALPPLAAWLESMNRNRKQKWNI